MARTFIEKYHGEPTIMINGVPYPPMAITICRYEESYLKRLGEAGMRIFFVQVRMRWNTPGGIDENGNQVTDGFTAALQDIESVLKEIPDAYIILRLNVNPPMDWIDAHPEELRRFNDGSFIKTPPGFYPTNKYEGVQSMASELWKQDADAAIIEFFEELEKYPCFERIIGTFLVGGAGYKGEWINQLTFTEDGRYGDCSEPFRKAYGAWLAKKYGTEEVLRKAWNRSDATFEDPIIPNVSDRDVFRKADKKICENIRKYYSIPEENSEKESHIGVFLNMETHLHTADYYDAINDITAELIVHFGKLLKERHPELLYGTFYGAMASTDFYDFSNVTGTLTLMESEVVDMLSAPNIYNDREPGKSLAQREMQDSFRVRNMIYFRENDARTHLTTPLFQRERMSVCDVEDSINVIKRDFAHTLCDDVQGWWFDMRGHFTDMLGIEIEGEKFWYDDPDILKLFKRQQEIALEAYQMDRKKNNEIALIFDNESVHCVSERTNFEALDLWRSTALHQIGAPVDWYFHDDMDNENMPDYKLYVMVNQYNLSDAEREMIFAKARKNHAVVLWLYAPGFINREKEKRMSLENVERTVGMKLGCINHAASPFFRIENKGHSALQFADAYQRYGYIDQLVRDNLTYRHVQTETPYLNPCFYIDDPEVQVLGRYTGNKLVSYGMREVEGFTSVYCCTQTLHKDLLSSLAAYAGCHLYTDTKDVLYANNNYVAVHATYSGLHRITFKEACCPVEVFENKCYGENVTTIEVEMHLGETKMWKVK